MCGVFASSQCCVVERLVLGLDLGCVFLLDVLGVVKDLCIAFSFFVGLALLMVAGVVPAC